MAALDTERQARLETQSRVEALEVELEKMKALLAKQGVTPNEPSQS